MKKKFKTNVKKDSDCQNSQHKKLKLRKTLKSKIFR